MVDDRTNSKWEHVQGECIDGVWKGHKLQTRSSLYYMTAQQVLETYPTAQMAISRPSLLKSLLHKMFIRRMNTAEGHLPFMFKWSMQEEDSRRDRMELGLGVVMDNGEARFYPMETVKAHNNLLIDTIGDERIIVYVNPQSKALEAVYTYAHRAEWVQDAIVLNTGECIRNGFTYIEDQKFKRDHPRYLFTRWYGFAYTFPKCSIYEG